MYDLKQYWDKRGKSYYQDFRYNQDYFNQEIELLKLIYKNNIEHKTVLEFGCGFGRITNLLLSKLTTIECYDAIDISDYQIIKSKELVKDNRINFIVSDVMEFNTNKTYDLVIASELLMHIPHNNIINVVKKISSMCKYFIHIDYYQQQYSKLMEHNFNHDYNHIYNQLGLSLIDRTRIKKQVIDMVKTSEGF